MKQLEMKETEKVSGGDYHLRVTAKVGSSMVWTVSGLFSAIVNGQIASADQFATALNNAITNGANFDQVRLESITFSEFN